jgi:cell division protein FtsA
MARHITVGIDVGTYQVKVVVAEQLQTGSRFPKVLGTGYAMSKGMRHGYIINATDLHKALKSAISQAEKAAQVPIRRAYLSVGGIGLDEVHARAEVSVVRADLIVTDHDVSRALEESERRAHQRLVNRKVLHVIPLSFRTDGQKVLGRPQGMKCTKLEVETLFITTIEQHLQDLIAAVEEAGVSIIDVMASPLAGSFVTLTKAQKMAGCVLANVGAETVSIVVFEDNVPVSLKVFPIGSTDITHDIALGLKVSLDDAEQIKKGALIGGSHSKKKLDEIVGHKLTEVFTLIEAHLTKIGKNGLLPAGIIITGGGSGIATIEDLARVALKLPSKRATLIGADEARIRDSSWAVAYGLCIWGFTTEHEGSGIALAKNTGNAVLNWFKQFLP